MGELFLSLLFLWVNYSAFLRPTPFTLPRKLTPTAQRGILRALLERRRSTDRLITAVGTDDLLAGQQFHADILSRMRANVCVVGKLVITKISPKTSFNEIFNGLLSIN